MKLAAFKKLSLYVCMNHDPKLQYSFKTIQDGGLGTFDFKIRLFVLPLYIRKRKKARYENCEEVSYLSIDHAPSAPEADRRVVVTSSLSALTI